MSEKKISEVTVRLEEGMKRDLQDLAAHDDRTLSDTIRILLETALYGLKTRHDNLCGQQEAGQTKRGNA
jgi:hypothetical protein